VYGAAVNKHSGSVSFVVVRRSQNFSIVMPKTMTAIAIKQTAACIRSDLIALALLFHHREIASRCQQRHCGRPIKWDGVGIRISILY
jgi:hypothetical protein